MKYIKYSLIILVIAIMTDIYFVSATVYPTVGIALTLTKNQPYTTSLYEKNNNNCQTYEHTYSFTAITDPCTDCQILVTPKNSSGETFTSYLTKMNNTYVFTKNSGLTCQPGNYKISIKRNDTTLMNTSHSAAWNINP